MCGQRASGHEPHQSSRPPWCAACGTSHLQFIFKMYYELQRNVEDTLLEGGCTRVQARARSFAPRLPPQPLSRPPAPHCSRPVHPATGKQAPGNWSVHALHTQACTLQRATMSSTSLASLTWSSWSVACRCVGVCPLQHPGPRVGWGVWQACYTMKPASPLAAPALAGPRAAGPALAHGRTCTHSAHTWPVTSPAFPHPACPAFPHPACPAGPHVVPTGARDPEAQGAGLDGDALTHGRTAAEPGCGAEQPRAPAAAAAAGARMHVGLRGQRWLQPPCAAGRRLAPCPWSCTVHHAASTAALACTHRPTRAHTCVHARSASRTQRRCLRVAGCWTASSRKQTSGSAGCLGVGLLCNGCY